MSLFESISCEVGQPLLPNATVMTPGDLFGDSVSEVGAGEEELPVNPAEWLASLGAKGDGEDS